MSRVADGGQSMLSNAYKISHAGCRVADGGQRVVRRLTEKEEREKRKADERAAKEEVKLKEKEEKEKARAEARRAARFPIDDLEVGVTCSDRERIGRARDLIGLCHASRML